MRKKEDNFDKGFKTSLILFLVALIMSILAHIFACPDQYKYDEKTKKFIISEKSAVSY